MFFSPLVVLSLSTPAEAANTPKIRSSRVQRVVQVDGSYSFKVTTTTSETDANATFEAEVESDAASETVEMVQTNAWMHGTAELKATPGNGKGVLLIIGSNDVLFKSVAFSSDGAGGWAFDEANSECTVKGGCDADSAPDIEVLAGEIFPALAGGYSFAFDLAGADLYNVTSATLVTTEPEVTTCTKLGCTTTGGESTSTEVFWDDIGEVWEGDLTIEPEGLIEVKVTARDGDGKTSESAKTKLGGVAHFIDDWQGETGYLDVDGRPGWCPLGLDDDPLTSMAMISDQFHNDGTEGFSLSAPGQIVTIFSYDYTAGGTVPVTADVEVEGGKNITIPANSYQFMMEKSPVVLWNAYDTTFQEYITEIENNPLSDRTEAEHNPLFGMRINGGNLVINDSAQLTMSQLASPVCIEGTCVVLTEDETGNYALSATAYASSAAKVPSAVKIEVVLVTYEGKEVLSETVEVEFDDAVSVLFANQATLAYDPIGVDISGKVSLLGAADKKGKQKTLSKGKFYGQFTRDDYGNLGLGGADKDTISAKGDILIGGEPIDFELTDTDKDGVIEAPPVVLMKDGKGTSTTASTTAQTQPQLL